MIFSVNMRRLPARVFAVIMAVVIAFVFVSSDAHPTSVAAEEPVYISEVKLFYGYDLNDAVSFVLVLDRATQYSEKYGEGVLEQFLEGLKENHKPLQKANVNDWIKNGYNE